MIPTVYKYHWETNEVDLWNRLILVIPRFLKFFFENSSMYYVLKSNCKTKQKKKN